LACRWTKSTIIASALREAAEYRIAADEGVGLARKLLDVDGAAGLGVGGGEAVGGIRRQVVVVGALQQQRRRQPDILAAFEGKLGAPFRHRRLVLPIGMMRVDQPLVAALLHHAVARMRIGDRPADDHVRHGGIGRRGRGAVLRQLDRRVARIGRPHDRE